MRISTLMLAAALPIALAAPARATDYVRLDFSGQVLAAAPGAPAGVGAPISFEAIFDMDKLVDHTQSVNAATGLGYASVETASLADDPNASLSIRVGTASFSKFDEVNYGTPEGDAGPGADLGAGDFPVVTFLNGSFAGVSNLFVNADGLSLDADPIAAALGAFGGFDFLIAQPAAGNPFANILAAGDFDAASATITPVPEPAAWALMLAGFGGVGAALRRRRRPAALAAA